MRFNVNLLSQHRALSMLLILGLTGCAPHIPAPITLAYEDGTRPSYVKAPVVKNTTVKNTTVKKPVVNKNSNQTDFNDYARRYDNIPQGGYQGSTYTVKKGDTLYYIAYITGTDVENLAQRNNINASYGLNVGQVLNITSGAVSPSVKTPPAQTSNEKQSVKPAPMPNVKNEWQWPTAGKLIASFSAKSGGNRGIDISGERGQAVVAASSGRVVYAGNALRGYGNLIIIKHSDDYLSAYAHNDTLLVKDKQDVKAGQKIAMMGDSGTNAVKLHFELRYKGKSIDPLGTLPKR